MHLSINTLICGALLSASTAQAAHIHGQGHLHPEHAVRSTDSESSAILAERATTWKDQLNLNPKKPVPPTGYPKQYFYEHFANYKAGAQPSKTKWTYDKGTSYKGGPPNWGTGEVQVYTDKTDNIVITKTGTLQITPMRKTVGGITNWTSARIETTKKYDFKCPAGAKLRIQASIKLGTNSVARSIGIWPAFWSLGSAYRGNYQNWPAIGEVDILESANGAATAWQTVHCGFAPGGPCNEFNGLGGKGSKFTRGAWHLVSVDVDRTNKGGSWKGEKLVWRIDGTVVYTLLGSKVNNQTAWNALARTSKMLLLNVAVGGGFPDYTANPKPGSGSTPNTSTLGGKGSEMEVRYVAVFGSK